MFRVYREDIRGKGRVKMYNDNDLLCIVCLEIEIRKMLFLEGLGVHIDLYLNKVKTIYEDFKKYNLSNGNLLEQIYNYINENEQKIYNEVKDCFE